MLQVETFEVVSADPLTEVDEPEEFAKLTETLGLAGQERFIAGQEAGVVQTVPYRVMTREEEFIYRELCPKESALSAYSDGPIPVRVLQVAAHAQGLDFFKAIKVWSADTVVVPDPVLVASATDPETSWRDQWFILARWGDELRALAELLPLAVERWAVRMKAAVKKSIAEAQADLASLEHADAQRFSRDTPSYIGLRVR